MTDAAVWRSRAIFITSTFRDMHAERSWLHTRVFPVLAERLRERYHHLDTVDLRWGVEANSATAEDETVREIVVLTVCLNEIQRTRPFLIGLLGDRYGWIPPAARATAAATEVGLSGSIEGRSITDLEIQHGVLHHEGQEFRGWFYLRTPLPYERMRPEDAARYSDAYTGEEDATDKIEKLKTLKQTLKERLPDRVRSYTATWDDESRQVIGLDAWGSAVEQDIWSDLELETAAFLRDAPSTWQDRERLALDAFVESRARGFVGRDVIAAALETHALSPTDGDGPWAVVVTSESGGGKSSLFGHLLRRLAQRDVIVLAHAAGTSPESSQVWRMLRRWCGELASAIGEPDPLGDGASADDVDRAFSRLLQQAAASRRVVMLIDALNQLEASPRGTDLTWLPQPWPAHVRLIATAVPGAQSRSLLQRPGVSERPLLALDVDEATAVLRDVCRRYHRTLNARVEQRLLAKTRDDGTPAFGSPLWLVLATEELNLLDADVYEQAQAAAPGGPPGAERIVTLLTSVVDEMPGDVAGLYDASLAATERRFGKRWTRAFVNALGVSRGGWREADLAVVMPQLADQPWDDLRFATLRRALRAHVVQRGLQGQWDFSHDQMREAIRRREDAASLAGAHAVIASHLLALGPADPVHESETLVHLMEEGDRTRAAAYCGRRIWDGEANGATDVLAALAVSGRLADVVSLLSTAADDVAMGRIAELFVLRLNPALGESAPVATRLSLLTAAQQTLASLGTSRSEFLRAFSVSHTAIGGLQEASGNLTSARASYEAAVHIDQALAARNPNNVEVSLDLRVDFERLGDAAKAQGDLQGAARAYDEGLRLSQQLLDDDPSNEFRRREWAISRIKRADIWLAQGAAERALDTYSQSLAELRPITHPELWVQKVVLRALHSIGDIQQRRGALSEAADAYRESLVTAETLVSINPSNPGLKVFLAISHERLGEVHHAHRAFADAVKEHSTALSIRQRLADLDAENRLYQRDLSMSYEKIGDVRRSEERFDEAADAHTRALSIRKSLAATDLTNVQWRRDVAISYERLADICEATGDLERAFMQHSDSLDIVERLTSSDPSNADWQRDRVVSHCRLAFICHKMNNPRANHHWARCHEAIQEMERRGMMLDPQVAQLLGLLNLARDSSSKRRWWTRLFGRGPGGEHRKDD